MTRRSARTQKEGQSDQVQNRRLPAMSKLKDSMMPLWQKGQLAFVPFAGSEDLTRSHFETQDSIELGRLIVDVYTPWQDFCPSASVALTRADITVNSSFRIRDILAKSKGTQFHLRLIKFLTSFYTTEKAAVSSVVATEATSYMLLNSRLHLGHICKDEVTRD